MAADQSGVPVSLSAKMTGSFAYITVRDRLPTILTKAIDALHRNKNKFLEEYGEEGITAEKQAIGLLSKLRNELQTDKPALELTDSWRDTASWNEYLQRQQKLQGEQEPVSWFKSPWLFVECYMYRRLQEALNLNPPISGFDVFNEAKTQSFLESRQAMATLCSFLEDVLKNVGEMSKEQLLEPFTKLLKISLWGNKCDLSISLGQDNSQKTSPVDALDALEPCILVNDAHMVWSTLNPPKPGRGGLDRVDIVLDNSGFELATDLVLADFLVSSGLARSVHFHGKCFAWFVSDVTENDFRWTVRQTAGADDASMSGRGSKWEGYLRDAVWSYHDHPFWTQPHEFCDMAADAPDLYAELRRAQLLLFKGDLNYRKLTGDRCWPHTAEFGAALRGFGPAPLCSLRTLKADIQVGLRLGQAEELAAEDPTWMITGKYAVIQFHNPNSG